MTRTNRTVAKLEKEEARKEMIFKLKLADSWDFDEANKLIDGKPETLEHELVIDHQVGIHLNQTQLDYCFKQGIHPTITGRYPDEPEWIKLCVGQYDYFKKLGLVKDVMFAGRGLKRAVFCVLGK